jgi:hypothetical protein
MIRQFLSSTAIFLLITIAVAGQDSAGTFTPARDPARSRVIMMSTGQIMPPKRFTASLHELFVVQLGYAPDDRIQFNATATLLPVYFSTGAKVQLIAPSGYFHGLAAGVDIGTQGGFFGSRWHGVYTANVAASAGIDGFALHGNIMGISTRGFDPSRLDYVAQAGTSIEIGNTGTTGAKLLGELWFRPDTFEPFDPIGGILGIRAYGPVTVWEAALIFSPGISLTGHSSGNRAIFPYLSFGVAL